MTTHHNQVRIQHGNQSAEVDDGLASLILALWRRGYRTISSCEGDPETQVADVNGITGPAAWIAFTTKQQAHVVAQHVGGHAFRPSTEIIENADADDPVRNWPNLGVVAFPASDIEPVLATVRGRAAVEGQRPKKLPRAPRDEWSEGDQEAS